MDQGERWRTSSQSGIPPYPRELFSRHIFITHCNERITSAKRKLIRHQREEIQCDPYLFYLAEFLASGTKWRRNNFFAFPHPSKCSFGFISLAVIPSFPHSPSNSVSSAHRGCCYPAESGEFSFRDPPPRDLSIVLAEKWFHRDTLYKITWLTYYNMLYL